MADQLSRCPRGCLPIRAKSQSSRPGMVRGCSSASRNGKKRVEPTEGPQRRCCRQRQQHRTNDEADRQAEGQSQGVCCQYRSPSDPPLPAVLHLRHHRPHRAGQVLAELADEEHTKTARARVVNAQAQEQLTPEQEADAGPQHSEEQRGHHGQGPEMAQHHSQFGPASTDGINGSGPGQHDEDVWRNLAQSSLHKGASKPAVSPFLRARTSSRRAT